MTTPKAQAEDISLGVKLPGEEAFAALLYFLAVRRSTMSQENRDAADKIENSMLKGWNNWWVSVGWPGEKIP